MPVSDEHIERVYRKLEEALGPDEAVTLMELLGWRATDALDRRLGRDWNR